MKKLAIVLLVFIVLGLTVYVNRLSLIMKGLPLLNAITQPVIANQPVVWDRGPERAELPPEQRPPNIVVILADDMGFNDISFHNGGAADGTLQTPAIDSIAREGVYFSNGYAGNATCAPSRAAIMTGRYATRFGFEFTPMFKVGYTIFDLMVRDSTDPHPHRVNLELAAKLPEIMHLGMPLSEITIAEKLKEAGYHTVHIGKWHLGGALPGQKGPLEQGFDESLYMSGMLHLPEDSPDAVNVKQDFDPIDRMQWAAGRYATRFNGGEEFEPDGYLTDYHSREAIKVIEANRHRPFFLYLAYWGIHNPLQAKKADYDALAHIGDHRLRVYAAMIRAVDRGVGQVLEALQKNGLAENTLVVFTSDNGGAGYIGLPKINYPYRGWKATFFEGGTHVPFFMRWPKEIRPGSHYDRPVAHIDLFATTTAAAKVGTPNDRQIDGVDLLPFLSGQRQGDPHEALFWRSGHYQCVIAGGWKMMRSERPAKIWLFHLSEDPTGRNNLAAAMPAKVAELQARLEAYNAEQVEPIWPSPLDGAVMIDKTSAEPMLKSDEFVYWPN